MVKGGGGLGGGGGGYISELEGCGRVEDHHGREGG